ncbi:MarR family transcriptional regulator [Vibrio sp. SM6]|uniref:MarR family transcriptional regulator n=1 Tax=Vibrio agarilyticus TaxID=2726741 RepID=A0A7X8YI54_9VIBR|nr:MarR family transcriptional regulator [Vibrio agarilyticus]NLS14047.1 MarR family transcriptional regulator [Vibrio agarilyticus]
MRLAHKRKVQLKLQKRIKATVASLVANNAVKPVTKKLAAEVRKVETVAVEHTQLATEIAANPVGVTLTPKQQQVLDIVAANAEGINPKGIGLAAGQDDAKAASWATGALKKLLEENLVVREQVASNKVIYKRA